VFRLVYGFALHFGIGIGCRGNAPSAYVVLGPRPGRNGKGQDQDKKFRFHGKAGLGAPRGAGAQCECWCRKKGSPPDNAGAHWQERTNSRTRKPRNNSAIGTVKKEQPGMDVGLSKGKVTQVNAKVKYFLKKNLHYDKNFSGAQKEKFHART
jgi:hypothetical protein